MIRYSVQTFLLLLFFIQEIAQPGDQIFVKG